MEEPIVVTSTAPPEPSPPEDPPQEKTQIADEEAHQSPNESEYDSAGSYSDEEGDKVRPRSSRDHTESDNEGSVGLERESGDGQESVPSKKVDDDEDKKNPQYIPKRGTFYEHDDRTIDDDANANIEEKDKDLKKKVWQDKKERWSHDRFNDSEQAPKSRAELVAIYGYDIRNEDGPPRARRRRRYGRGPNKYTRNWEDEDAYNKPPPPRVKKPLPKKPIRNDEFPPLNNTNNRNERNQERPREREDNKTYSERTQPEPNEMSQSPNEPPHPSPPPPQEPNRNQQRVGSGRVVKPKREIKDSDYRGFTTKTRQVRNMKTDQKIVPKNQKRSDDVIQTQNFTNRNNNVQELEKDMAKLNVQDGGKGKHGGQRQGSVPPRLQTEQKGSKRYSSIRQRSLPESATPPFSQPQHSNYYSNEFNQSQVPLHQNAQIHPSTTQVPQIAPPPLPPIAQVPVTAAPILQAPQFAPPFAQAPPFLQPAPPFIPPQTPQIINYVPSQPQFTQGYQGYQQQYNQVNQQELFQPQGGITYYSTDQQVTQRAAPPKRPKAAIPIVAPPPIDLKGKVKEDDLSSYEGDISAQSDGQTGDSSTQESNIQDCGFTWNMLSINSSHFKR